MLKRYFALFSVFALAIAPLNVEAAKLRMRGVGGVVPAPDAPILNSITVNYGQYTANGMGGVRLSSQDDATSYAVPVYGLGLMSPSGTPCANWTTTQTSGTANHFAEYTGAEGTTARTPTIASAGDTNNLQQGPYVWNVSCTDANGHASNTATITYNIVANAANIDEYSGNFPDVTSGFASFASTSGYKILLSTGFKKLTALGPGIVCPTECEMGWADPTKPGLLQSFTPLNSKNTKLHIKDVIFTGPATAHPMNFGTSTLGTNTLRLTNVGCKFKSTQGGQNPLTCLTARWKGAPGDSITNFVSDWVAFGATIEANDYTIKGMYVSNFATNAMNVSNVENLTVRDWLFWNPQVPANGLHTDCWQIANGASIKNWDIDRGGCVTAGGYSSTQGPMFPGHTTIASGYISDGSGGPGLIVKLPAPGPDPDQFFTPSVVGSQIFAPGCIAPSDNARVVSSNLWDTATLTGIAPVLCGSAGSPINIGTYTGENIQFKNTIHTGSSSWGMATHGDHGVGGMSNFAYVGQVPAVQYGTTFIGDISGTTLTVHAPTTSTTGGLYNVGIVAGGGSIGFVVFYSGLVGNGLNVLTRLSGSANCNLPSDTVCTYTLDRAPGNVTGVAMTAVPPTGFSLPVNNMAPVAQLEADLSWIHTGSGTLYKDGWSSTGMVWPKANNAGYQAFPPANTTITNVYGSGAASAVSSFANGDPKANLEAVPQASWYSMTAAQVLAQHCHFMMPKAGGPLDNGDGTWASPFRPDSNANGSAEWSDGTEIPGCN